MLDGTRGSSISLWSLTLFFFFFFLVSRIFFFFFNFFFIYFFLVLDSVTLWCSTSPTGPSLHIQSQSTPQPLPSTVQVQFSTISHPVCSPLSSQRSDHVPPVVQRWWKDVKEYEEGRVRVLKPRLCRFDSCNLGKKFF